MERARLGGRRIGEGDGGRAMKGWEAWNGGCSPKLWENGGAAGAAWVRRAVCAHTKKRLGPLGGWSRGSGGDTSVVAFRCRTCRHAGGCERVGGGLLKGGRVCTAGEQGGRFKGGAVRGCNREKRGGCRADAIK